MYATTCHSYGSSYSRLQTLLNARYTECSNEHRRDDSDKRWYDLISSLLYLLLRFMQPPLRRGKWVKLAHFRLKLSFDQSTLNDLACRFEGTSTGHSYATYCAVSLYHIGHEQQVISWATPIIRGIHSTALQSEICPNVPTFPWMLRFSPIW